MLISQWRLNKPKNTKKPKIEQNQNDKILTKPKNTKKPKIEQNQNFTKTTKSHRGQNLNQNNKIKTI